MYRVSRVTAIVMISTTKKRGHIQRGDLTRGDLTKRHNVVTDLLFKFAVLVISLSFSIWLSLERLVSRDEGFYTFASHLVSQGTLPYIDFFYPQMPALPFLYSLPALYFEPSWEVFRITNGFFFGMIIFLTFLIIAREAGMYWGLIGSLLVASCHLSIAWFSVVQTYSVSVFFTLLSLYCFTSKRESFLLSFLSGFSIVFAVASRLFFLPLVFLPLLFLFSPYQRKRIMPYFIGACFAAFPLLYYLLIDMDLSWFNNLGYHLTRSQKELSAELRHKWRIFEVLFSLGRPSEKFSSIQTPFIFFALFFCFATFYWQKRVVVHAAIIGCFLFVVSFLPSPVYVQYFVTVVPFAAICTVLLLASFINNVDGRYQQILALCCMVFLGVYLFNVPGDFLRYTETGEGVIGVGSKQGASEWNLNRLSEVRRYIEKNTKQEDLLLSLWPGYLVGVDRPYLKRTENHFGLRTAEDLSEELRLKYRVKSVSDFSNDITQQKVSMVIGYKRSFRGLIRKALKIAEYKKEEFPGLVEVWSRKKEP